MTEIVLGINPCVSGLGTHDPSAVLVRDGEIVYGVEEERFTRVKHAMNTFPARSIQACLESEGIGPSDVDRVSVPWCPDQFTDGLWDVLGMESGHPGSVDHKVMRVGWRLQHELRTRFRSKDAVERELSELGDFDGLVEYSNHHECHAVSAFYPTELDEALVLTLDGRGESDATVVWHGDEDGLTRLRTEDYTNSLGFFFGAVTKFLGFYPNNGEGKVMGLAPYGEANPDIEETLRSVIDTSADYDVSELSGGFERATDRLEELFERPRKQEPTDFSQWEKDLAYTTQSLLEELVTNVVERYTRRVGTGNVALAGGVALNCKMNKRIMELDEVDRLFVQPVSNDAGSAIGAALLGYRPTEVPAMSTTYWGPSHETDRIQATLETNKVSFSEPASLEREVAADIADGKLVGWFQGRLEMGPRALGNRSILADPRTIESLDRVNEYVKHREAWRPFAPSMLEDAVDEYLVDGERAPYMIKTFDVPDERKAELSAVLHPADYTTRPQTVNKDQNPRYYRLIREFENITGVPVVLNTSFNDHAEPIVNTPTEALKDFFGMGLDTLVLGDVIVRKGETSTDTAATKGVIAPEQTDGGTE